LENMFIR